MPTEAHPALPRFNKRVLGPIYDHVFSSLDNEVGGVLVGHYLEPGSPPIITGSIAALAADGARASVTFTHEAWSDIHEALDRRKDNAQIVGWYHSHPGFGIFLSEHDLFIHRNFFSDPAQVAFVVDPHAAREGTFGWVDGDIVKLDERDTARRGRKPPPPPDAAGARRGGASDGGGRKGLQSRSNLIALGIGAVILGATAGALLNGSSDSQPASNKAGTAGTTHEGGKKGQHKPKTAHKASGAGTGTAGAAGPSPAPAQTTQAKPAPAGSATAGTPTAPSAGSTTAPANPQPGGPGQP
jgi:proteasome lid subunit RPN8/RPN11